MPGDEIITVDSLENKIYAYYRDRTLIEQGFPIHIQGHVLCSSPVLANIDNDSYDEIIFITKDDSGDHYLNAYKGNGSVINSFPKFISFEPYLEPVVDDIDDDEVLEILIGDKAGNLHVFDLVTFTEEYAWSIDTGYAIGVTVFDINNDGLNEIICSSDNGKIVIKQFKYTHWDTITFNDLAGEEITGTVSLGDIDNDEKVELLACMKNGDLYCYSLDQSSGQWDLIPEWWRILGVEIACLPLLINFDIDDV